MAANQALTAYKKTEIQAEIHPVKLIHMMYERVLLLITQTEKAIQTKNIRVRGENLGKTIALIAELNTSIVSDNDSESSKFLRGLYSSILVELPKVSLTGNVDILRRTYRYIAKLKKTWEETAMREQGLMDGREKKEITASSVPIFQQKTHESAKPLSISI